VRIFWKYGITELAIDQSNPSNRNRVVNITDRLSTFISTLIFLGRQSCCQTPSDRPSMRSLRRSPLTSGTAAAAAAERRQRSIASPASPLMTTALMSSRRRAYPDEEHGVVEAVTSECRHQGIPLMRTWGRSRTRTGGSDFGVQSCCSHRCWCHCCWRCKSAQRQWERLNRTACNNKAIVLRDIGNARCCNYYKNKNITVVCCLWW